MSAPAGFTLLASAHPCSPNHALKKQVNGVRDDAATYELREMMGLKTGSPVPEHDRSSSAASTDAPAPHDSSVPATPSTPPLGDMLQPTTPPPSTSTARSSLEHSDTSGCRPYKRLSSYPSSRKNRSSWQQTRKVFIGGVPQSIDENGFYSLFSTVGEIEKAWLQMFHDDDVQPPRAVVKHRGFGFVIFKETHGVDQLLGREFSRYITFGDGVKLEVKRAVAVGQNNGAMPVASTDQGFGRHTKQDCITTSSRVPQCPPHNWQNATSMASPQQSWQSHPWLYANDRNLPETPPFPSVESMDQWSSNGHGRNLPQAPAFPSVEFMDACQNSGNGRSFPQTTPFPPAEAMDQWHGNARSLPQAALNQVPSFPSGACNSEWPNNGNGNGNQFCGQARNHWNGTMELSGNSSANLFTAALPSISSFALPQPSGLSKPQQCALACNVLLDGFLGQKPRNHEELELVLRNAMPECYDD